MLVLAFAVLWWEDAPDPSPGCERDRKDGSSNYIVLLVV